MIKRLNKNQIFGLDFLRGIAIILMFITHGFRLFVHSQSSYVAGTSFPERLLNLFAVIEPYTSSLFLFLAGIGITLSFQNNKDSYINWIKRHSQKSLELYILGIGFFFLEKGVQFPDILLSPSILSTIAFSILVTAISLKYKYGNFIALVLTGLITLFYQGTGVSGINMGPGGIFPLIMFTLLGSIVWQLKSNNKYNYIYGLIGVSIGSWVIEGDWVQHYNSMYKVWINGATGIDYIISSGQSYIIQANSFWNHSFLAFLRLISPLIISLSLCIKYQEKLQLKSINHYLTLLGRHALGCYILHLSIIAIFEILKIYPTTALIDWLFIAGLVAISILYSKYKEK